MGKISLLDQGIMNYRASGKFVTRLFSITTFTAVLVSPSSSESDTAARPVPAVVCQSNAVVVAYLQAVHVVSVTVLEIAL